MDSSRPGLRGSRLLLRRLQEGDRAAFTRMNGDPRVMQYFPRPLSEEESRLLLLRIEQVFAAVGYGLWAIELPGREPFVGFTGLLPVGFDAHFTPAVEVGWRLLPEHWGRGYATEAGWIALDFAFSQLGLPEVVSFTATQNGKSRAVMERIGMARDPAGDFDHPKLEPSHPLRRHVLYRITRAAWAELSTG